MSLLARIRNHWMLLVPAATLAIVLAMNARTGYALANGSLLWGGVFIIIGVFTAYAADHGLSLPPSPKRAALIGWLVVGILFDVWCGWVTAGMLLGDGAAARQTQAESLSTLREQLSGMRDARKAIGQVRAVDAVKSDLALECSLTSPRYKDGNGPKCTRLKTELATAEKAVALDADIPALVAKIDGRKPVASGDAEYTVPMKLSAAAGYALKGEDFRFAVELIVVPLLTFLSTIGWWIIDNGRRIAPHAAAPADPGADFWGPRRLASPEAIAPLPPQPVPLVVVSSPPAVAALPPASSGAAPPDLTAPVAPASAASSSTVLIAPRALPAASTDAADAPVKRFDANAAIDKILTFKAARLEAAASSEHLPVAWAYADYVRWAKGRAVTAAAFQALLEASGSSLVSRNGAVHLTGVRLRDVATAAAGA